MAIPAPTMTLAHDPGVLSAASSSTWYLLQSQCCVDTSFVSTGVIRYRRETQENSIGREDYRWRADGLPRVSSSRALGLRRLRPGFRQDLIRGEYRVALSLTVMDLTTKFCAALQLRNAFRLKTLYDWWRTRLVVRGRILSLFGTGQNRVNDKRSMQNTHSTLRRCGRGM